MPHDVRDFEKEVVDTEAFPEEAGRYGVRGIPNVKLFVDGRPVDEFVGALPEGEVRRWLDRALPSDADRAARAAVKEAREVVLADPRQALKLLGPSEPPADLLEEANDIRLLARTLLKASTGSAISGARTSTQPHLGPDHPVTRRRRGDLAAGLYV